MAAKCMIERHLIFWGVWVVLLFLATVHRGAFCQFTFRWVYYCHSSKSTRKEIGKTYLCAVQRKFKISGELHTPLYKIVCTNDLLNFLKPVVEF